MKERTYERTNEPTERCGAQWAKEIARCGGTSVGKRWRNNCSCSLCMNVCLKKLLNVCFNVACCPHHCWGQRGKQQRLSDGKEGGVCVFVSEYTGMENLIFGNNTFFHPRVLNIKFVTYFEIIVVL